MTPEPRRGDTIHCLLFQYTSGGAACLIPIPRTTSIWCSAPRTAFSASAKIFSHGFGLTWPAFTEITDIFTEAVGGVDDHVHLRYRSPAALALSKSVYLVKAFSSKWMKQFVPDFDWQEGYGGFGVSVSNLKTVIKYIHTQGSYHKKISFQQEYLTLLKKHNLECDPRYVLG